MPAGTLRGCKSCGLEQLSIFREPVHQIEPPAPQLRLMIRIVELAVGTHDVTDADCAALATDPLCQCIAGREHFARRWSPRLLTHTPCRRCLTRRQHLK